MNVSDYELLEVLYRCKNITKTAEVLYLAQSTVSKRLRSVEEEMGITIVLRSKTGVEFTPEGEYLAVQAAKIHSLVSKTNQHIRQMQKAKKQSFTIGASNSMLRTSLPDILREFEDRNPDLELTLVNERSSKLISALERGKLDLAFVCGDAVYSGERFFLQKENLYLLSGSKIDLSELPGMTYLQYLEDPDTVSILNKWWRTHFETSFPKGMHVNSIEVARDLIRRNLGYTFSFSADAYPDDGIEWTPLHQLNGTSVYRDSWCLYPKDSMDREGFSQQFLELVKEQKTKC